MPLHALADAPDVLKTVTVVFTDVVGSTLLGEQLDPESLHLVLGRYFDEMSAILRKHGGTVRAYIGDAVMAVFGLPAAHEDDALRAVRAADEMRAVLERLNEELDREWNVRLASRTGVNTGEVVAADPSAGQVLVSGDAVNVAARLETAAGPGEVLIGEPTYRLVRAAVEAAPVESLQLKGKSQPIPAYRLVGVQSWVPARVREHGRRSAPLIGRDLELRLLRENLTMADADRAVQLVTIIGEPGVGKSRLVEEFLRLLGRRKGLLVRRGHCLPYGDGITFWPLGEIVKTEAGILESDDPEQASQKLAVAVARSVDDPSDRDWAAARLAPLVGATSDLPSTTERAEAFAAWRRFLEGTAARGSLILLFEDLHWADEAMLDFLQYLANESTVPLMLLCTARPEFSDRRPGWTDGRGAALTLHLSPLTDEETARLISSLLARSVLPVETQAILLERAGGNPLYAEEFVGMLLDRGVVQQRGGAVIIGPIEEIPVPDTVQAVIAARLDGLSPGRKALLQNASVVGKVFWSGAVASMGGTEGSDIREALGDLASKELVRPTSPSSVSGEFEYTFWHILIRDVAYGQIPRTVRVRKHRAAAEWIERMAGDRVADHAELLAYHYGEALELARTSRATSEAEALQEPARRFMTMAGDRAMRLDVGRADAYYARALDLTPVQHHERADLLTKRAEAAQQAGRIVEAERLYEDAVKAFSDRGAVPRSAEAMVELSRVLWRKGETMPSRAILTEAVRLLENEPPGPELVNALTNMGGSIMLLGSTGDALEWLERAEALAERLGLGEQRMRVLGYRGLARCDLGDREGLDDLRTAVELARALELNFDRCVWSSNLAGRIQETEGPAVALPLFEDLIEFAGRRGMTGEVTVLQTMSLQTLFDLGRWEEVLSTADHLIEGFAASGGDYWRTVAEFYKCAVLLFRGDFEGAAGLVGRFVPRAREIADPQILVFALSLAAVVAEGDAKIERSIQLAREVDELTREVPGWMRAQTLPDLVGMCVQAGEVPLGERLVEGVESSVARYQNCILTASAILAEGRGGLGQAVKLYDEAARRWGEYGSVLEHGRSLLGSGRCLVLLGKLPEAADRLSEARAVFDGLRALPLLAEASRLLERAGSASQAVG